LWLKIGKLLENSVPIIQALTSLRDRKEALSGKSDFTVVALNEWISKMNNGDPFSEAVSKWVPHQEYLLLMAGERSGDLPGAFTSVSKMMLTIKEIKGAVLGGVAYPAILGALAIGVSYMFGLKIFPGFFAIASEDKWTGMAVHAISFSHFVEDYLYLVIIAMVLLVALVVYSLPRWDGNLRTKMDKHMPYAIYRTVVGSTWLMSLSAMISAGERIEDALVSMKKGAGKWLSNRIEACLVEMRHGHSLGEALGRTGYDFPDIEIIDDLGVYSTVSGFDEALATLGDEWSTESVVQVKRHSKVMFGVGMLLVFALLAFLIIGLLSMQLQLGDVIRSR
jgi:type II secretory pathway component PulF